MNKGYTLQYKYLSLLHSNSYTYKKSLYEALKDKSLKNLEKIPDTDANYIDQALEWAELLGNYIITYGCDNYPPLLKEIANPPLLLYVKGNPDVLQEKQLAIVGCRLASPGAKKLAINFAKSFADNGFTVTSGLALGIDTAAHHGALQAKYKSTIAVLGSGIEFIYPFTNKYLVSDIIANNGAVVSEFPLYQKPAKYTFPQRNRIISGMSLGVVVVEAAAKSGSMITARLALEQNKEVFAVSGGSGSIKSRGCHDLIRDGAKLVDEPEHVLEDFGDLINCAKHDTNPDINPNLDEVSRLLLANLDYITPMMLDELGYLTKQPTKALNLKLVDLELMGFVTSLNGNYYLAK